MKKTAEYISKEALLNDVRETVQRGRDIGEDLAVMHYLDFVRIVEQQPTVTIGKEFDQSILAHVEYTEAECGREK